MKQDQGSKAPSTSPFHQLKIEPLMLKEDDCGSQGSHSTVCNKHLDHVVYGAYASKEIIDKNEK